MPHKIEPYQSGTDLFVELGQLQSDALHIRNFTHRSTGDLFIEILRALALLNQRTAHCPLCALRNSLPPQAEAHDGSD